MNETEKIKKDFQEKVSSKISIISEGTERFRVFTPFRFTDGDHYCIILKRDTSWSRIYLDANGSLHDSRDDWMISDEGHTLMHLTYWMEEREIYQGTRYEIIKNALSLYGVEDREGILIKPVQNEAYGDTLFDFIQAIMKITDVTYLTREKARSVFMEDFFTLVSELVPRERITKNWYDKEHDPKKKYKVDCRINGMSKPLFVFGLTNDGKVRDATISLLKFENWNIPFHSLGIFEDQEKIGRSVLARFTDICEKQYSSIADNKDRIARYIKEIALT